MKEKNLIHHPFFKSYNNKDNVVSKSTNEINFFEILSNLTKEEKQALLKGESKDIISELESYSGNISTSQLKNIDYSKFSNHVFFDSAVHKVKYAFEEIIKFPYDANQSDYLSYISNIDGYTKHLLENDYPKYKGHIEFTGNQKVITEDRNGWLLNDYKKDKIEEGKLSPTSTNGFSFSFHIHTPDDAISDNQTLFKKIRIDNSDVEGYYCFFTKNDNNQLLLNFAIKSLEKSNPFISTVKLDFDSDYYINIVISKNKDENFEVKFFVDTENTDIFSKTETFTYEMFSDEFKNKNVKFVIGSGESNTVEGLTLGNFIGKIDEFIFFNKARAESEIRLYRNQNVFSDNNVLLYYKFNEIGGAHNNAALIIDSSGNKLHGVFVDENNQAISDTTNFKINDNVLPQFLKNEDLNKNPIILGNVITLINKRNELVNLAKNFDAENSNIIFNLLPSHYFSDAKNFENKPADFISIDTISNEDTDELSSIKNDSENSHMTQICLIWARFFDQLKLYVDALSGMFDLDYDSINREDYVNTQMYILCKIYGFDFVEIFENRTFEKNQNKNIEFEDVISEMGLSVLQNLVWKKILVNSQDIIRSKGTLNSINSLINAIGFDIKKYAYIEEKSSQNYINLKNDFELKAQEIVSLNFTNFKKNEISYDDSNNLLNHPILKINNIKSIDSSGQIRQGFENEMSIEVFFSLSKSLYTRYLKNEASPYKKKQSILQFINTENSNNRGDICWANLYIDFKSEKNKFCDIVLEYSIKDLNLSQMKSEIKILKIPNINIFEVDHYVSVNIKSLEQSHEYDIEVSINHSILADSLEANRIDSDSEYHVIKEGDDTFYTKHFSVVSGNKKFINDQILNNISSLGFEGKLYNIKLWKKSLTNKEMLTHAKDILSIGENTLILKEKSLVSNFMFTDYIDYEVLQANNIIIQQNLNNSSFYYSFLDVDTQTKQEINACIISLEYEENVVRQNIFNLEKLSRKTISSTVDKVNTNNLSRVRILSFKDEENKKSYDNYEVYPIHENPVDYETFNTNNLSINLSSAKIVNDAIERLIDNIERVTDLITSNMKIYDYSYIDIDYLRRSFFDNYDDKLLVDYDSLNNIFKYFDNIMNSVVFSLIPSGIGYNGFNLVYESHVLERSKYQHKNKESNLPYQQAEYLYNQTNVEPTSFVFKRNKDYITSRRYEVDNNWL